MCDDYKIDKITAYVYNASNKEVVSPPTWDCALGQGKITGVPSGTNMWIKVIGTVQYSDEVRWEGSIMNISVSAGKTTEAGIVIMKYSDENDPAPTINYTYPSEGALDIPVNDPIKVIFNEDMVKASLNTSSFTLVQTDTNTRIGGTIKYDPNTYTATFDFDPNNTLSESTSYTATITTDVQDLAGNPMTANYVWSFVTASKITWYKDTDGDGYSDGNTQISSSRPSGGYYRESDLISSSGDCNDNDNSIYHGASEICDDGIDQDCSGTDLPCTSMLNWDHGKWDEAYWN